MPQPLAETLLRLKAQHTKIADIQRALENVHTQNSDSELNWKLKFESAAVENERLFEKLRGENADLRKALGDAYKYIDLMKRAQVKMPKATKRETVTIENLFA
ncbi:MAG: hypothetical protein DRR08_32010 [Candidatus Parabeggiatoa sp. nov. 2]|nr:MAG: hypothetical protein B6247_25170 [Beggiatoa sp. 4572_84]RKZ47969.1 MAG: hypothetical protein DRR08_32010 [Gammaproteobacteria bacterium]